MTDTPSPTTARRMLGQILGRHHRHMMVSGTNCAACHNYHPTSPDLINAIEAEASGAPAEALNVERLAIAMSKEGIVTSMALPKARRIIALLSEPEEERER